MTLVSGSLDEADSMLVERKSPYRGKWKMVLPEVENTVWSNNSPAAEKADGRLGSHSLRE
jgi:hypothetical protein